MASKKKSPAKKERSGLTGLIRGLYIFVFIVSLLIVAGFTAYHFLEPAQEDGQVMFDPLDQEPEATGDIPAQSNRPVVLDRRKDVYTCLLIGSADMGGTDTIMLGVFDTGAKTASLVSIPRDTVVRVQGSNRKINAVQSVGGTELLVDTVERTLAVPVDYYVEVDTYAFKAIVDQIGGVYFDVPVDMNYDDPYQDLHIHIAKGYQKLDGSSALGVMRCRSCYVNADIGRTQTQRSFLAALAKQTVTLSNVSKVTSLINILNTYVDSDMPVSSMVWFGGQAVGMDLDTALSMAALPGSWISPYYELDDAGVLELVNSLGIYEGEVPMDVLDIYHP